MKIYVPPRKLLPEIDELLAQRPNPRRSPLQAVVDVLYEGRPYFISKALAGRYIRLVVLADRLIVDAAIPLHKEYPLV